MSLSIEHVGDELLHTYTKVYKFDVLLLIVRLAVLTAVTLTVPVVLFPVSLKKNVTEILKYEFLQIIGHVE